jgi:hypothetical protein
MAPVLPTAAKQVRHPILPGMKILDPLIEPVFIK